MVFRRKNVVCMRRINRLKSGNILVSMKFQSLKMTKKGTLLLQELNWGWQQQWEGWTGVEWQDLPAGKVVTISVWKSIIEISLFYSKKEAWE